LTLPDCGGRGIRRDFTAQRLRLRLRLDVKVKAKALCLSLASTNTELWKTGTSPYIVPTSRTSRVGAPEIVFERGAARVRISLEWRATIAKSARVASRRNITWPIVVAESA
jgi:hypothetical protein